MSYKEYLTNITTLIFDVDGVLTDGTILVATNGDMFRKMHTKDGYVLELHLVDLVVFPLIRWNEMMWCDVELWTISRRGVLEVKNASWNREYRIKRGTPHDREAPRQHSSN